MAKKLLKAMLLPLTVMATALAFIACDGTAPDVKYKVTYVIGADAQGTAPTETDKAFGEKFVIKGADGFTYAGMLFRGWSDGNITYQAGDTYTMPSKAVTFTAQWDTTLPPVTYSVTYDLNGGTGETPAESYKGASETFTLALADGFSYEGKEFDGWSDGTDKYDAGAEYTMSGKAVVFTAQWKDAVKSEFTVTYKYGAAGEDVVKENQTATNYTLEAPVKYQDFGENDEEYLKLFAGWTVENGDGTVYLPESKLTLTDNTVFTAQWVDFDDDNVWFDTNGELQLMLLSDKVGAYIYRDLNEELVWTYFAYAVSGTAITVTPTKGNPATGTLDDGELTINITVGLATYSFSPEQALPTFTFELNDGTGTVPTLTVTEEMYDEEEDCYVVTMPENTITPPEGKQFKEWLVTAESGGERRVAAGESYYATAGTYTVAPVWEDAGEPAPAGIVFYGNCTLPTSGLVGGETVVQIILNTTDPANVLVHYQLVGENSYTSAQKVSSVQDSWKPTDVYGADAFYYGSYRIGAMISYNMVVKSDLTALWLCDTDDEPLDNGEFTLTPLATATYTVTYTNPNGATGELPAAVTVDEGAQVTLAAATQFTKDGWEFQGWKVTGQSDLQDADAEITVTENITITPIFGKEYTEYTEYGDYEWIIRDDGFAYDGLNLKNYTLDGNNITVSGYGEGRLDDVNKTIKFKDDYAGLTATAANGATLELDGFGGATLGNHVGTYTVEGMMSPVLKITFGTAVVNDVEVLWDDYGYTAIGLNINATITIDGTDYVFGSQEVEPITISQHFVGTFAAKRNGIDYVVKITMDSVTVTIGSAEPVEAEVTDYDDWNGITFMLGQDEWYIQKDTGFDDDVDSIRMIPEANFRDYFTLGRPTDAIIIAPEYRGTFVGGGYTVIVTKYAVIVQNGDAAAIVAELEDYDEEYSMISMTLNGDEYTLLLDETGLYLTNDDESVDVTLTPDNGSEDEGNGVPAKFYGYYSDDGYDYIVYITDKQITLTLASWDYEEKEATNVEYYSYFGYEGINVTANGVDYDIQLISEVGGQATVLKLYIAGAETELATLAPVEW